MRKANPAALRALVQDEMVAVAKRGRRPAADTSTKTARMNLREVQEMAEALSLKIQAATKRLRAGAEKHAPGDELSKAADTARNVAALQHVRSIVAAKALVLQRSHPRPIEDLQQTLLDELGDQLTKSAGVTLEQALDRAGQVVVERLRQRRL